MRDYRRIDAWKLADGLIRAVEKEAGTARKLVAGVTSAIALLFLHSP